jgi:hypothetical protein
MTIRRSVLLAVTIAFASMLAPAMSLDQHKAAYACSAMAIDPSSAVNLRRPSALRYKAAPLRLCVREDTNQLRPTAAV